MRVWSGRRLGVLVALLAAGVLVVTATASARESAGEPKTVKVAAQITSRKVEWKQDAGNGTTVLACNWVHVIVFPEVKGATAYQFDVTDAAFGGQVRTIYGNPPGFEDGNFVVDGKVYRPPAGKHWVGLSGGSGPAEGCAEAAGSFASRYKLVKATATVEGYLISGTVKGWNCLQVQGRKSFDQLCSKSGLRGARVVAKGPATADGTVDARGRYSIVVPKPGSYTVRVAAVRGGQSELPVVPEPGVAEGDLPKRLDPTFRAGDPESKVEPATRTVAVTDKDVAGVDFAVAVPTTIEIRMQDKEFGPRPRLVAAGGTVRFCASKVNGFVYVPYFSGLVKPGDEVYPKGGNHRVKPGECVSWTVPSQGGRVLELFDAIHPRMDNLIYVVPD